MCLTAIDQSVSWESIGKRQKLAYCANCRPQLNMIRGAVCRHCGRLRINDTVCHDCQVREASGLSYNRSVYHYDEACKQLLALCKYRYHYHALTPFKREINQRFLHHYGKLKKVTLVPVPVSTERIDERLFNQSALLASMIERRTRPLLKKHHTEKQALKTKDDRLRLMNPFYLAEDQVLPKGVIVLIDDVYTTGTTIHHAANVLKSAGFNEIYSFTLAR
jgi:competence protein ComFC